MYRLLERDVLKNLLIKEEQIRLAPRTQQLLASIEDRTDIDWMDVIAQLQTELIREEIGQDATDEEIQRGLRYTALFLVSSVHSFFTFSILRSAHQIYDDDEFHQLSLYVRHNRAKQGHLVVGDDAVDIQLLTMQGESVSLLSHCHSNRPLLIIAGSYT